MHTLESSSSWLIILNSKRRDQSKRNTSLSSTFDNTKSYFSVKLSLLTHFLLYFEILKIWFQATSVSNSTEICCLFSSSTFSCNTSVKLSWFLNWSSYCQALKSTILKLPLFPMLTFLVQLFPVKSWFMKYKMSSNNSNPDVDRPTNLVWDYSDISIMETFFVFTSSKICSICEGPFFKDKITTPDCNHWMHQVCYMEFCKTNSHCATCKRFFN